MSKYYLYEGGEVIGPSDSSDLLARVGFGPASLVMLFEEAEAGTWKLATDFSDFSAVFAMGAVPPPLPLPKQTDPPEDEETPARDRAAVAPAPLVMIVDDKPELCEIIGHCARTAGFRTVVANSGLLATKKIAETPPNLIVLDLMMPGQNGYQFLLQLQATGFGHIPVFVMSAAKIQPPFLEMICDEKNVVDFIAKPFDVPVLIEKFQLHAKPA